MNEILIQKAPRWLRQMVKYGMVGALATTIDFALLNASHHVLVGASGGAADHGKLILMIAAAIGYSSGTVTSYALNSRWTFRYDTRGKEARKLGQFAAVSLVGLSLTMLIIFILVDRLHLDKNAAKAVAVAAVFFWNFSANKLWTFRKAKRPTAHQKA